MTPNKTTMLITSSHMPAGKAKLTGWSAIDSFSVVLANREILLSIVQRDLLSRFRGSILGYAWLLLLPIITMAVYSMVFSHALGVRFEGTSSLWGSALATWFSLVVWQVISECLNRASSTIHDNAPFLKRIPFPIAVLPASLVLTSLSTASISFCIFAVAYFFSNGLTLPFEWFFLPIIIAPLAIGLTGIVWILSAAGGLVRDIRHVVPVIITLGMFATPVVWPMSILPETVRPYVALNPLAWFFETLRDALFGVKAPDVLMLLAMTAAAVTIWIAGFALFRISERRMRDVV